MEKKKFIQTLSEKGPEQEIIIKPTKVECKEKYENEMKAVKESKLKLNHKK